MTRRPRDQDEEDQVDDEDDQDIPLHRRQPFGAGLKRKKIEFVRAQDPEDTTATTSSSNRLDGASIGDLYASLVFKSPSPSLQDSSKHNETCTICGLDITTSLEQHNSSLAHQASTPHSHPPSHLDRSRMGLRALAAQGWDPDARVGLGARGEGPRFPIKVVGKEDNLGIGAVVPEVVEQKEKKETEKPLTRAEAKRVKGKERERDRRLEREIYGREDVERLLSGKGKGGDGLR